MPTIKDFVINSATRDELNKAFRQIRLNDEELRELAPRLGVQPRTLEGWTEGRGEAIPKAVLGQHIYSGNMQEEWQERAILATSLLDRIGQRGEAGRAGIYRDDVSGRLIDCLDRVKDYLTASTADDYLNRAWRSIAIYWDEARGEWSIEVLYARVNSSDE